MQMIEYRLEKAYNEMQHLRYFDYVLINDDILTATEAIISIARSLKYQQLERFSEIIHKWQDDI